MNPDDFAHRLALVQAGQCPPEVSAEYAQLNLRWESGDLSAMDEMIQLLALPEEFYVARIAPQGEKAV